MISYSVKKEGKTYFILKTLTLIGNFKISRKLKGIEFSNKLKAKNFIKKNLA